MFRTDANHQGPSRQERRAGPLRLALLTGVMLAAAAFGGDAEAKFLKGAKSKPLQTEEEIPFKVAQIYFETNGSACDMGIQIVFDTEGITSGQVRDPGGSVIHLIRARAGLAAIGGQTEGFLQGVEPVIFELVDAPDSPCEPDPEDLEDAISLDDLFDMFPEGTYEFEGRGPDGTVYDGEAELTYDVPAGPELGTPDGEEDVDPDQPVDVTWEPVTLSVPGLLPNNAQEPVDVVAYQVLVFDGNAGDAPDEFNVTVSASTCSATECSVTVPAQFLMPGVEYEIEVLAIEASHNQTITEGSFTTAN